MKDKLFTYSNGYGHLAVTLAIVVMVFILLLVNRISITDAKDLVTPVILFWFMSGASKFNRYNNPLNPPPAPEPPPASNPPQPAK
jgi:hypothetical protein